jgi:glucose/arabinose dehydrogenase
MPRIAVTTIVALLACPAPAQVAGVFKEAAALADHYAAAAPNPVYTVMPMTVELRAKVAAKDGFNILIANEPKNSVTHWEIFADKSTGRLCAFWPGFKPDHARSSVDIADDKWHAIAMNHDGQSVALFVDGKEVARQKVEKVFGYPDVGQLTFGRADGVESAKAGIAIDEVRISRVVRDVSAVAEKPFEPDKDTVGLWHFDGDGKAGWPDASITMNAAKSVPRGSALPAMSGVNVMSNRWGQMDFGPFFSSTLGIPSNKSNITHKAVTVRLGKESQAAVAFDTELLRVSAAWTGGFVKIHPGREGLGQHPEAAGDVTFETIVGPGWNNGESSNFMDRRRDKLGPLPGEQARYKGLYLHGQRTIFAYTVGTTEILETFDLESKDNVRGFGRTIEIGPSNQTLVCRLLDVPGASMNLEAAVQSSDLAKPDGSRDGEFRYQMASLIKGKQMWVIQIPLPPRDVALRSGDTDGLIAVIEPREKTIRFKVAIWPLAKDQTLQLLGLASAITPPQDLNALTTGGPPRWGEPLITKGALGDAQSAIGNPQSAIDQPYVVDTLTAPEDNPFKSFLRLGGHDFFKSGDLAVCSVSGDVWIVSNIDDKLERLTWKRFATGLHQPLGLRILNDKIHVLGRDQITRLHDLNNDGEADLYENVNNKTKTTANGHAYATNLETDPQGNFYFTKCADETEFGGTLVKVSADGKTAEPFAVGLRNPNGAGVSPTGLITVADNQGEWIPASRLDVVEKGEFLGYKPMAKGTNPRDMGKPLCFMPQNVDNSSGGQVWVTSDKWGPFNGDMLHTSYGGAALLHVMMENVDGQWQGGVTRFPLKFETGIMRGRFSPKDGQLYLSGLRGWQTVGHKSGAIHRVRYTGAPVHTPKSLHVHKNGVRLIFPAPLDKESAGDAANYAVLRWTYKWTGDYPSRHWSVENPKKQGYDTVEVTAARVSADGKTVFLEIPEVAPVLQQQIKINVKSADGSPVREDVYHTIHALGPAYRE